jgi:hypothetical protein
MEEVESALIRATLERTGGNKTEAARILGIPRRTFYSRLDALGLGDRGLGDRGLGDRGPADKTPPEAPRAGTAR